MHIGLPSLSTLQLKKPKTLITFQPGKSLPRLLFIKRRDEALFCVSVHAFYVDGSGGAGQHQWLCHGC